MEHQYFSNVFLVSRLVIHLLHADVNAPLNRLLVRIGCKGDDFAFMGQVCLPFLVFEDLLAGFEAVHHWHLQVHDDGAVELVFALGVLAFAVAAVFEHFEGLQTVIGFFDNDSAVSFCILSESAEE